MPRCGIVLLITLGSVRRLATDAPLHISDDGLATLIHMDMFDPDSLRAAVPQPA
jgi:hypothetical protein